MIFEKDGCIGGVWNAGIVSWYQYTFTISWVERVFDAFWTQNPLRMTSFSDATLEIPKDAPRLHDPLETKYVIRCLEDYVNR